MADGTIGNMETDDETNNLFVSLLKETPNEDAPRCSVIASR